MSADRMYAAAALANQRLKARDLPGGPRLQVGKGIVVAHAPVLDPRIERVIQATALDMGLRVDRIISGDD